jgi:hypothetical protein
MTATELAAARMHWVRIVQEEAFAADLHFLRRNLPLPSESKIARYNTFLEGGLIRLGG